MGPGGDFATRRAAAHLLTWLKMPLLDEPRLIDLPEHRIIFETIAGYALLVRVQGHEVPFAVAHARPWQVPMVMLHNLFLNSQGLVTRWAAIVGQVDRPMTSALLHHMFTHPWELSETAGLV